MVHSIVVEFDLGETHASNI